MVLVRTFLAGPVQNTVEVAKLVSCARAAVRLARRLTGALIISTPNASVSLAHARVGEVDRVEFAMEFVVRMFMAEEAGTRRRAILRRT